MKITPLEIRQHEFEKTFRGYNIEEVDNFLSNISQEWERVLNESKMLRMQLEIAEKEANKLREIEMTLFKTLKTAEDTSNMITEQANQQADKHVQEARLKGEQIILEAQQKSELILQRAKEQAKYIKEEVLGDVKILEKDFKAMDHYKDNLMVQMKSLANATLNHVERFEQKFDKESIQAKFVEATSMLEETAPTTVVAEPKISEKILKSAFFEEKSTNDLPIFESIIEEKVENIVENNTASEPADIIENVLEEEVVTPEIEPIPQTIAEPESTLQAFVAPTIEPDLTLEKDEKPELKDTDDLSIIEGIGPKIANILFDNGIFTFRHLATTPVYKIKEMLDEAGPHFSMHDPSTWVQQALLAAEERWTELDILKEKLNGGRIDKEFSRSDENESLVSDFEEKIEEKIEAFPLTQTVEEVPIVSELIEEPQTLERTLVEKFNKPVEINHQTNDKNNIEAITEEMLEKVNKVKMAIRKAMVEKADTPMKDTSPLPTVKDVIAKKNEANGSFFDNL
jgi:cell division initiation protein